MDRDYISPYSDDFINLMIVRIMALPTSERSAAIEKIEFSERIFDFPIKDKLVHSERQVRSILVRISGVAHDIHFKAIHSKNTSISNHVSPKNRSYYKSSINRRESYRARHAGSNKKSYYDVKKAKYWCDAYVLNALAYSLGFRCALITITALKEHHESGLISTAEIVRILNKAFKKFTSTLRRKYKNKGFGFKVIQLHENGIPHLHAAIFYDASYEAEIKKALHASLKSEPVGFHQFKTSEEGYEKDHNKVISYLSRDVADENSDAALSKFNGCASRSFEIFGKNLKTALFDM
ncbi:hypothetical protein CFI10_12455 [Marinobacterium iners]|uniref:hypothetical protein n=1 Tax=Marinobacterium iners TaxID=48076 RepID=UPI001A900D79|nr:hypothetical protein [Marinobacterium iners]QSR35799.1 hypothetical protein CFI10_12455 [Marinobacterium iners]